MLASIDTEHDPGIVTAGKGDQRRRKHGRRGMMVGGAWMGEAGLVGREERSQPLAESLLLRSWSMK